jgi:transcriptional regulator with XRE-family HTH domain
MTNLTQAKTAAEKLAEIHDRLETSASFRIEGLKFDISEQIYLAMEREGLSQTELAQKLGTSRAYITKVLQGNANFTLESLAKFALALDCDIDVSFISRRATKRWEEIPHRPRPISTPLTRVHDYMRTVNARKPVKEDDGNAPIPRVA